MKIDELEFGAGRTIGAPSLRIRPKRVTLFIGPNNGGKSRALNELEQAIVAVPNYENVVFSNILVSRLSQAELDSMLEILQKPKLPGEDGSTDTIAVEGRGGRRILNLSVISRAIQGNTDIGLRRTLATIFTGIFSFI